MSEYPLTLIHSWIYKLLVESIDAGVLSAPAPILARAFNELADGMGAYHDAMKIQTTAVPLAYQKLTMFLLLAHSCITPVIISMSDWTQHAWCAFIFTFLQVYVTWSMYFTAREIEYPFKDGRSNYAAQSMHQDFNDQIVLLMIPACKKLPTLKESAIRNFAAMKTSIMSDSEQSHKPTELHQEFAFFGRHPMMTSTAQAKNSRKSTTTVHKRAQASVFHHSRRSKLSELGSAGTQRMGINQPNAVFGPDAAENFASQSRELKILQAAQESCSLNNTAYLQRHISSPLSSTESGMSLSMSLTLAPAGGQQTQSVAVTDVPVPLGEVFLEPRAPQLPVLLQHRTKQMLSGGAQREAEAEEPEGEDKGPAGECSCTSAGSGGHHV
eukprot:gnl/TRDRNA2_/TRDRNA2_42764_c1_seq1.p1 gnl/TRDRNA2_/TRDRNA2_42764_c1~~gnl/TRDRNA2_/TRDRNA2_42764_c1_seq1.p1  ORF type:complete len:435 (-),score=66.00 gnl/TRDRNA2_/TRDRNA2_42764_c1_seq1:93-1241(-)